MGNNISYRTPDNDLGEISKGRWRVMRRLLEVFVDYVNASMRTPWHEGQFRNVVVRQPGDLPIPDVSGRGAAPPSGEFRLEAILRDLSDEMDEIIFVDASELGRLLAWADFLAERDGAFEFFVPLVRTLREKTATIDRYAGGT